MGNYRFKFSDMIPNAWFYKLRDLTKQPTKKHAKKKLHHNQTLVNSPSLTTSPSSCIRDRQLHHRPSVSLSSQSQHQRKSYYFTRDLNKSKSSPVHDDTSACNKNSKAPGSFYDEADGVVQLPRKSSKKRRSTKRSRASPRLSNSVIRTGYSCRSSIESVRTNLPDSTSQEHPTSATDTSPETDTLVQPGSIVAGVTSTETIESATFSSYSWSSRIEDDIVIDLKSTPSATQFNEHVDDDNWNADFNSVSKIELRPIKTKGNNKEIVSTKTSKQSSNFKESIKIIKDDEKSSPPPQLKRFSISSHSPGLKLRTNTPRILTQKIRSRKSVSSTWRRSLSDSVAVVTSSKDPQRDFRESMVEMIVEHNIYSSKELEDLLACYLSLNSYKHHDVIIDVFKQIWYDFVHAS